MRGLGDLVANIISIITLGQGKRIATYIAKLRGKEDCGCDKRQEYLNKKVSFKIEEMKTINLNWDGAWRLIREQVPCSCQFDYGYIEVKDKNNKFIAEIKFTEQPRLNGQLRNIDAQINPLLDPDYFEIKYHKKEGGYTNPVKIPLV